MRKSITCAILLLSFTAPGIGQHENDPYFVLSSNKTFAVGEKPIISLSVSNLEQLDFRVYRVKDPYAFFSNLEDPHEFGGRVAAPPRDLTPIERFHNWKRSWRTDMVNKVRYQFTRDSRHNIHSWTQTEHRVSGTTNFVEAPLLNPSQVVATWTLKVVSKERWETQDISIDVKDKGVYLVEAVHGTLRAYAIVSISDLALVTKSTAGRLLVFAANRRTGEPAAGAELRLLTGKTNTATLRTDAQGLADFQVATKREDDIRLMAKMGDDFAAASLASYSLNPNGKEWASSIYTDRPVYRPGHTVNFRAIVRTPNGATYRVPAGTQVDVQIQDPEQKTLFQKSMTLSSNGTLHGELTLPMGSALGYYNIEMKSNEHSMSSGFQVEEYKKPEYEVRAIPTKPRVIEGEPIQATIDARYYFGEPVNGAKVEYAVYRSRSWSYIFYTDPDDEQQTQDEGEGGGGEEQVLDEHGTLDADGKLSISIPTTVSDNRVDYHYRIEARVTDAANREITGTGGALATYASFQVNVEPTQYFFSPGSQAKFKIQARDYDNKPVATSVKVDLVDWNWTKKDETENVRSSMQVQTDAQGIAEATITLPSNGSGYRIRATANTPEKRESRDYAYIWISGGSGIYEDAQENIQIVPDKKSYKSGEMAKVLIITGVPSAKVLVTVEGKTLDMPKVISATNTMVTVDVPVTAERAPNFFVAAAFFKDGVLHQGKKSIRVPPIEQQLDVKISTPKPQYHPGDAALYSIDVKDSNGRPVAGEFSLGVVDEAIYAIRKDTTPTMVSTFYGKNYDDVATDSSMTYYFRSEAGRRRMRLAALRRPHTLAQLKPERLVQPKVRKAFPDTIYWGPTVTTNAQGHAETQFNFPDSLTAWRATARGITLDSKVGDAVLKTIVRKNLIMRLSVPRFFTQGDEVVLSGIVHNYLTTGKSVRVSLSTKGLDIIDGGQKDVTIPSHGEAKVEWRVRAQKVSEAVVTGQALTDEESDALELTLPVHPQGVKLSQSKGGSLSSGQASAAFTYPPQTEPTSRTLDISISPSIAGALFGALDYLTAFPYGCVEQTMSSFLPNIIVAQTLKDLKVASHQDPALLQEKIRAGLDRLYDFQHENGGWGWWKTDDSHVFMTAYVIAGLSQARAAGTEVKQEPIDHGATWLRAQFDKDSRINADLQSYILYSLANAGKSDAKILEQVWGRRSNMSPYGLAFLGLTLQSAKDERANEVVASLEAGVKQDVTEAYWPSDRDPMLDFSGDTSPETTAYALKLLARVKPDSPLLPKAALWLLNHRNEGYWWSSTKQTAMVVYGLVDYLKHTGELTPNLKATVYVNGKPALAKSFGAADALSPVAPSVHFVGADLPAGENQVRVEVTGTGRLYWSARGEYFSTEPKLARTGSMSLNVLRDYFKLTPGKDGEKIVYTLDPMQGPLAAGDTIAVRLTVSGSSWKYLLLEDPIPAGTEFIEKDDLYEIKDRPSWWQYYFTRRELHDDRMAIFQTFFDGGQQQYFYLLKVVNPGQFHVNPARIQPMYQPEYLSTSENKSVEVK